MSLGEGVKKTLALIALLMTASVAHATLVPLKLTGQSASDADVYNYLQNGFLNALPCASLPAGSICGNATGSPAAPGAVVATSVFATPEAHGAPANTQQAVCTTTTAVATQTTIAITLASCTPTISFSNADNGKAVAISQIGTAGATLATTISGNPSTVGGVATLTLGAAVVTTVTAGTVAVAWGNDDSVAIQAAWNAINGTTVTTASFCNHPFYGVTSPLTLPSTVKYAIEGCSSTIIALASMTQVIQAPTPSVFRAVVGSSIHGLAVDAMGLATYDLDDQQFSLVITGNVFKNASGANSANVLLDTGAENTFFAWNQMFNGQSGDGMAAIVPSYTLQNTGSSNSTNNTIVGNNGVGYSSIGFNFGTGSAGAFLYADHAYQGTSGSTACLQLTSGKNWVMGFECDTMTGSQIGLNDLGNTDIIIGVQCNLSSGYSAEKCVQLANATTNNYVAGTVTPSWGSNANANAVVQAGTSASNQVCTNASSTFTENCPPANGLTSGSAAPAGLVGEQQSLTCRANSTATVSITAASPAVVTWTALPATSTAAAWTCAVNFTGTLPTGMTTLVTYYLIGALVSGNNFSVADTAAHALACANTSCTGIINTTGSTQTPTGQLGAFFGTGGLASTSTPSVAAMALGAGIWSCPFYSMFNEVTSLTATKLFSGVSTADGSLGLYATVMPFAGSVIATNNVDFSTFPLPVGPTSSTTNVYDVSEVVYSAGSLSAGGYMNCTRVQ